MGSKFKWLQAPVIATLTLPTCALAHAEVSSSQMAQHIRSMFDRSQEVVIGTVTDVRILQEKSLTADSVAVGPTLQKREGIVEIRQVYKGSPAPALRVAFEVQIPASFTGPALETGETGLLFLISNTDGTYAFANREWGYFRLPFFQPAREAGTGPELLEKDLDASLAGEQRGVQDTLRLLMTFHTISAATQERVSRLTAAEDVPTATGAYAVLLNAGKDKYYPSLLKFLSGRGAGATGLELVVIYGHVQDPGPSADPKIFDQLSMVPQPAIKLAAMFALRRIRSGESVPTLIAHLKDPDRNIEYLAVMALHDIVQKGNEFGPSNFDFDKSPQKYIDRWKQWWDDEGKSQYAP